MDKQPECRPTTIQKIAQKPVPLFARFGNGLVHLVSILGLVYVLLIVLGVLKPDQRMQPPELTLIALILLFNSGLLVGLEQLVFFTNDGVTLKRKQEFEQEQQRQRDDIATLRFLIESLITGFEIQHLRKLCGDTPYPFSRHAAFDKEIRNLRDLGFIEPQEGQPSSVAQLPQTGEDLRQRFRLTKRGQRYLELLDEPQGPARSG